MSIIINRRHLMMVWMSNVQQSFIHSFLHSFIHSFTGSTILHEYINYNELMTSFILAFRQCSDRDTVVRIISNQKVSRTRLTPKRNRVKEQARTTRV